MNRAAFFDALRKSSLFGGKLSAGQVRGIEGLLDGFAATGDGRDKTLAYGLATARREVGAGMVPVREGFKATDAAARAYVARQGYRYATPVNGQVYYGRGYVQLTWARNYAASSADAGVDLLANPDAALDPVIGARLLFLGIQDGRWNAQGKGIAYYIPALGDDDLKGARRTVNVTDHWDEVAGHYRTFLGAVQAAGGWQAGKPETPGQISDDEAEALARLVAWRAKAPAEIAAIAAWLMEMPA